MAGKAKKKENIAKRRIWKTSRLENINFLASFHLSILAKRCAFVNYSRFPMKNVKYEILLSNIRGLKSTLESALAVYSVGQIDFGLLGGAFATTSKGL